MVRSCVNLGNVYLVVFLVVFFVVAAGCTAVTAIIPVYSAAVTDSDVVVDGSTAKEEGHLAVAAE